MRSFLISVLITVYFLQKGSGPGEIRFLAQDLVVEDGQGVLLVDLGTQGAQFIEPAEERFGALREEGHPGAHSERDACCCEDGCELPDRSVSGVLAATGRSFGRILPFLLGGVVASTMAQVAWPVSSLLSGLPAVGALALMMGAGFALSLCSSSDAVIARSLASLAPTGALLGFMVYGPMMDVKNVALLASQFRGAFVARLFVTVTVVAAVVVGGAWWMGVLS